MRLYHRLFISLCIATCLFSCKKDNYAPPNSLFTGRIVYQGTPIGVKNNGGGMPQIGSASTASVYFELWQPGFGKSAPIGVSISQDGSFSELLFDGTYKLVFPLTQGPFMSIKNSVTNSDTIPVIMNGNQTMDINVLPYYMFSNTAFAVAADSTLSVTSTLTQIIKDANAKGVDAVYLYVNRTSFVDEDNNVASASVLGANITNLASLKLSLKVPASLATSGTGTATQNYFYVRAAVKITGVQDMLFTSVQQMTYK